MIISESKCVSCGRCVNSCPVKAIKFVKTSKGMKAQIDPKICIGCGYCVGICPVKAISNK